MNRGSRHVVKWWLMVVLLTTSVMPQSTSATSSRLELTQQGTTYLPLIVRSLAGNDWPQVQRDPQRTGYSSEILGTNIRVAWTHPFQPDKVTPQVQAIVYQAKVLVGTQGANGQTASMYALDAGDGHLVWKTSIGSPILASVAAADNKVFFGAMDGAVYALNSSTGVQVWKKQVSPKGFSTSPVFADNKVMLGGRDGVFYALDPSNGNVLWQHDTGSPILQTAAYNNGRAFFGNMSMYVYALNTSNGTLAWKSSKIDAMAFKDYWPVVYNGKVFIRAVMNGQNFFAFNESTGAVVLPNLPQKQSFTQHGAVTPPCVDRTGALIVPVEKGSYGNMLGRVDANTGEILSRLDDGTNLNNEDETSNMTCTGNLVFCLHWSERGNAGFNGFYNQDTGKWIPLGGGKTNYQMNTATGGGGGSPASVANGRVYHLGSHELVVRKAE